MVGTARLAPPSYTMALPASSHPPVRQLNRNIVIGGSVVLFHVAALWALQSGLLRRAVEVVVPVEILTELISPPAPKAEPLQAPKPPEPVKQTPARKTTPTPPAAPRPIAIAEPAPVPNAPVGVTTPQPAPAPISSPVAAPAAPSAPTVELPSSTADYLHNPKPPYPALSRRLGEHGIVVHRVLIGADGSPISAKLVQSSGFPRLDEAARAAVMRWRYVPGKRNGVAETMSFEVPINWVLE
jgi:protein TonB